MFKTKGGEFNGCLNNFRKNWSQMASLIMIMIMEVMLLWVQGKWH